MVSIKLYKHVFSSEFELFEADSIGAWLLQHYGQSLKVSIQIFRDDVDITDDIKAQLSNEGDYVVLESPGDPLSAQAFFAGQAVIEFVAPDIPIPPQSSQNTTRQSPNNSLANRTNQARVLQRIEDIYGTVRSIPTLIMPSYRVYENKQLVEYGYMAIGRGYYDVTDIRDGNTPASFITGSSVEIWAPFTSPLSGDSPQSSIGDEITEPVITARRSNEVDGITLLAANQINPQNPDTYTYAGDQITQGDNEPDFEAVFEIGEEITVSMTPYNAVETGDFEANSTTDRFIGDPGDFSDFLVGATIVVSGYSTGSINGSYTVQLVASNGSYIQVLEGIPADEMGTGITIDQDDIDYSGTYIVNDVNGRTLSVDALVSSSPFNVTLPNHSSTITTTDNEFTDWIVLDEPDLDKVYINVIAQQGMYKDSGGGKTTAEVFYEIEIESLDEDLVPTGATVFYSDSLSGATGTEIGKTSRLDAFPGFVRVRMRRTTPFDYDFDGAVVDEIKWADVYAVTSVDVTDFGDVTTVHSLTRATQRATAIKERQLNMLVTRKLPTYNGTTFSGAFDSTGLLVSGTISATKRFVDIVAAVSQDPQIGNLNLATYIDINQIYARYLEVAAWSTEYGDFSYTFDDDNTSFEETIRAIADACFCQAFRQNGKIRFNFEEDQASSVALFTHRNKRPNAETIVRKFAADAEYDGVEFIYVDPDSERQETIKTPSDATKYKKFELPGIREFSTAWVRARREYNKLRYQRLAIQTDTTIDGRLLLPNSRIDIVDNTKFKAYDGEVIAQSGLTLTLSKNVEFTPSVSHSIVFILRDGTIESITCTAGSQSNQVILSASPSEALVTEFGQDGIRTIYSFAADQDRDSLAYLVQEIEPGTDNYVTVKAINYNSKYYQDDNAAIPAKETVLA